MKTLLLLIALLPLCLGWGESEHGLEAKLHPEILLRGDQNEQTITGTLFKFSLHNPTTRPVTILKWGTPLEDGIIGSIFDVKNVETGKSAPFIGIYAYRKIYDIEQSRNQFQTILPGETVSNQVDLSKVYDFSSEQGKSIFSVSLNTFATFFTGTFDDAREAGLMAAHYSTYESFFSLSQLNTENVEILVAANQAERRVPTPKKLGMYYTRCTQDQINRLPRYEQIAQQQVNNAVNYLSVRRCDSAYVTWFGTYDANRWNTVKTNFDKIKYYLDGKRFNYVCEPESEATCSRGAAAWIQPSTYWNPNVEMHLCGEGFWVKSYDAYKGAVIYHELSHHDAVAGTRDHCYFDPCKQLAKNQPDMAIKSAGCYNAFAEPLPRC